MTTKSCSKSDFVPKTIVKTDDGSIGVICPDLPSYLSVLGPDEVNVVFDGNNIASGTDWKTLEIIGQENAVIGDSKKCGAGRGKEACIFITLSADGFECQRFGSMRWDLIFKTMKAERNPEALYPNCQFSE